MKVIASSVIRATYRGESHGGLYVVDLETGKFECVLDWDYPKIRWEGKGGDRGLRGLIFHGDKLFTSGARELFMLNQNFELVEEYTNQYLDGTHELAMQGGQIYNIANVNDSILVFDLHTKRWTKGYQLLKGETFDPEDSTYDIGGREQIHINSITIQDRWMCISGSKTNFLHMINLDTLEMKNIPLTGLYPIPGNGPEGHGHNAQFWRDGVVYSSTCGGFTVYQDYEGNILKKWWTPDFDKPIIRHNLLDRHDHARAKFTRGMALTKDYVIVGTSPATVHAFSLDSDKPVASVNLTMDIRNSICGMALYKWS